MKKSKLNRRLVAATAAIALSAGVFAAVPLSAEAKTNYRISKSSPVAGFTDVSDGTFGALVNGI